jgi:hypothetical protein
LQQSCAAADDKAVKATAMTNSATVAIIVFLFKVFLLIDSEFMISAQSFARAAAFPISHTSTQCRVGAKGGKPQARALAMLVLEDTTANWMKLRISHPTRQQSLPEPGLNQKPGVEQVEIWWIVMK